MHTPHIDDAYRALISKSPSIMAVRFVLNTPVESILKDFRVPDEEQVLLSRAQILGDYEERKNK